jgi:molecular chaperone HscC
MSKTIVGIDLGTTFSLVSTLREGKPVVLPNALGEFLTPSAVSIAEDGSVLVGAPARARATTHPLQTALAFKRDMGTAKVYELGGKKMTPQELSAIILATLKRDAEAALGCAVDEAVVTVPAYFGDMQRKATKDAGAIAGLRVDRIINEPTAAALAYGLHERHRDLRAIVLDLGGGTFDVTVLEIIEGVIEIQSTAGDARLGGEDFDEALAEWILRRIKEDHKADVGEDPKARARVKEAAEMAKKNLSSAEFSRIVLADLPVGKSNRLNVEFSITREQADEVFASVMDRLRSPILRAMRDAGVRPEKIDEVLLVGGSTRMPGVAKLAAQLLGRLPLRKLPPDEAVAMGAAVQAALKSGDEAVEDMVVTDVAPFSMGIASSTQVGNKYVSGIYSPILERGTVIPASRVQRYSTIDHGQRMILIEVYQGEHSLCRDNQKLGSYKVENIPSSPAGEQSVDVRFTYDMNGILEVETTIVATGKTSTLVIEKSPGRLSPEQIKAAREAMAKLKFHPRDALPNTTALARADALHVELQGEERAILAQAIAAFRAALEGQDRKEIDAYRDRLNTIVAQLQRK